MADGKLTDDEIFFLSAWLDEHENINSYWPGDILASRIKEALADGEISDHERKHLESTLISLIGGTLQETGATSGQSTSLPVNPNANIIIPNNTFCFTGTFIYGTRKKCEQAVLERGGMSINRVSQKIDYLVLGSLITGSWAQTSFGRKIEKAIEMQRKGLAIEVIGEDLWAKHL
ncbi:BRCT domain-containing protein [Pseudomonadota bacterium]